MINTRESLPRNTTVTVALGQVCQFWLQSGSDWPQVRQIRDFFTSDFSTFWLNESLGFVPFGANLTPPS